jgi:hypothetical protein
MTCSTIYYINFEFFGFGTFWKQAIHLCAAVGFPPGGSGSLRFYTKGQNPNYIRRNNTAHRTHKAIINNFYVCTVHF